LFILGLRVVEILWHEFLSARKRYKAYCTGRKPFLVTFTAIATINVRLRIRILVGAGLRGGTSSIFDVNRMDWQREAVSKIKIYLISIRFYESNFGRHGGTATTG
jgi:hypothetical protein